MTVLTSPNGIDALSAFPSSVEQPDREWSRRAVWGEGETTTGLICRQVHTVTSDVKTFLFEPEQPAIFAHEPGQFVTLKLQIDGREIDRCYTISTPPTRPRLLGITVKRQLGGVVSNWLHDTMTPGRRIEADGPLGIFTTTLHPADKYLFLSGGSGVTPLMSMTRTLYDLGSDADIVFVHSARTPADIIFRHELDAMASTAPGVRVAHVVERDSVTEPWTGLRGFLGPEMLRLLAPDLAEREIFCCGPAPYMTAVRRMLIDAGFDMQRYHEESFSFSDLAVQEIAAPAAGTPADQGVVPETTTFSVEFTRTGRTFVCGAGQNVLDAAFEAGLTPPSSCTQGMCGTCKTTLVSGTVDMQHMGGIRPREIAQGKVLICCSKPTSDLTIDS